jgi:hypothetical protein
MFRVLTAALVLTAVFTLGTQATTASADEVVHYQLKEWKAKHIHDAKKADTIYKTLKKLGCEVKKASHGDHLDVKYRCVKERHLPVKSHQDAIKWEKWFKEYGFKVYHTH